MTFRVTDSQYQPQAFPCAHIGVYTCTYTQGFWNSGFLLLRIAFLKESASINMHIEHWLSLVILQNPVTGTEKNVVINGMCSQFTLVS